MKAPKKQVSKPCAELAKKIGQFIEYWGFKEVHGRIWALIFLSKEPVDANFIMENLKISKALTSMSLNELMEFNVVYEVKKTCPGTQKYAANTDITQVIIDVLKNRETQLLSKIKSDFKALKDSRTHRDPDCPIDDERLESLGDMIESANTLLSSLVSLSQVDFADFKDVMTLKD